jgi:inorganic pyrophosphatase
MSHGEVEIVVEIPRGSRNKFEWDHTRHVIRLDRRIPAAVSYPVHYGFTPDTISTDGECLDALLMADDPLYPGVWVTARPVGVGWIDDEGDREPKVLFVPARDPATEHIRDLADVPQLVLDETAQFFNCYKDLEPGKNSHFLKWEGSREARRVIKQCRKQAAASGSDHGHGQLLSALSCPEAERLVDTLLAMKVTIAVAESCTGGLLAAALAGAEGSGDCLRGGVTAYDAQVKFDLLEVSSGPVITTAAVAQMAGGVARLLHADIGLATSGVIGPTTEEGQPLGTLCLGLQLLGREPISHQLQLDQAEAATMRQDAVRRALGWALEQLQT